VPTDPSQIPMTSLPLTLIATNVGASPRDSFATIVQTTTETQGSFREGDTVPGAGPIKKIAYRYVDFHADASKSRVERLSLFGEAPPVAPPPTVAEAPPAGATDDLTAMVDRGIKKIDDSNYEIDRSLVDQVLANPMQFSKGARVVPSVKNGKTAGFKLYAIRPNSAFAKLGLSNGDTLTSVNNMELTSADKALEVYTKVKESNTLQIEVTRRGKPMTITYSIK
jgi:general secretion pathway protein C